jgi:hypothetical protein
MRMWEGMVNLFPGVLEGWDQLLSRGKSFSSSAIRPTWAQGSGVTLEGRGGREEVQPDLGAWLSRTSEWRRVASPRSTWCGSAGCHLVEQGSCGRLRCLQCLRRTSSSRTRRDDAGDVHELGKDIKLGKPTRWEI